MPIMSRIQSENILNSAVVTDYRNEIVELLQLSFPGLSKMDLVSAVDNIVLNNFHNPQVQLDNNYTKESETMYLMQLVDYLTERKPIITATGCLFKSHGTIENPLYALIQSFLDKRAEYKKEMKRYPKGSADFAKYNLFQLIEKRSANAINR